MKNHWLKEDKNYIYLYNCKTGVKTWFYQQLYNGPGEYSFRMQSDTEIEGFAITRFTKYNDIKFHDFGLMKVTKGDVVKVIIS